MDEARGPEDRIEQIVREAESGAQFEFNPAAWSAMETKLNAVSHVPFNWWKLLFPLAGTAILLAILLWPIAASDLEKQQGLMLGDKNGQELVKDANGVTKAEKSELPDSKQVNPSAIIDDTQQDNVEVKDENYQSVNTGQKSEDNGLDERDVSSLAGDAVSISDAQSKAGIKRDISAITDPIAAKVDGRNAQSVNSAIQEVTTVNLKEGGQQNLSYFSLAQTGITSDRRDLEPLSLSYQSQGLTLPQPELGFEVDSTLYAENPDKVRYFNKARWAFSLAVSADLSATGLEGFTDPGTMVGFNVEYYLNDSWSIQTGATHSVKRYTALGSEYETPSWISGRPDALLSASAVCRVIDIPLNVRKYFQNRKGNTFFVSTGVSTYLMLREDYDYEYTEDRPEWRPFWSVRNQNNHFFGIFNLSAGYEKPLNKSLALSIEPFMKLPLTGIGNGRVRFLSFGTNLAIKLRK